MLRAVHIARVILQVYWTKGSHMRRLSLRTVVAVTVPAFLATPAALAQGYDDAPAAIALFSEENFYGDVRDVYDPFTSMNDLAFNDRTRSIAVFAGQWEVCEHKNFTGRCAFITEDVSDLGWFGLAGRISSVRPIYEYTEARHGLLFTRDKYGYIRYAHNETYGYDTWNYGYASSWGLSVSHYGFSPDYYRYGYYSPTWGYDPYGFAWGPRGTIRYTTSYRRHPRPSVLNPYWSGWDWHRADWRRGHWSWRDGRDGHGGHDDWRRDGRDGWGGHGGGRDWRDGDRDGRDGDGRGGRGDRDDRPPPRDVPGDRWGPGAGGSGSVTPVPDDPRPGWGGRDGRSGDGDGRGGRDGRDGRSGGSGSSWIPRVDTGTPIVTPPADVPRDPRRGRGGRDSDGALLGGPGSDSRGDRGGGRFDGMSGGGIFGTDGGSGRGGGRSTPAASPPPPPPPPPADWSRGSGDGDGRSGRPRGGDGRRDEGSRGGRFDGGEESRRDED